MSEQLTKCKACGKEMAKSTNKCIHCGKDQVSFFGENKFITSILVLFLLVSIGLALSGVDTSGGVCLRNCPTPLADSK